MSRDPDESPGPAPEGETITWEDLGSLLVEAKSLARGLLLREQETSLQTTELVLTALARLRRPDQDWSEVTWANRAYFFAALFQAMRRALIDHARRRKSQKRSGEVRLDPEQFTAVLNSYDARASLDRDPLLVECLMSALDDLRREEPDWATMIEHRFFGGLTLEETAVMMNVAVRTLQRWWVQARLTLYESMRQYLEN